MAQTYTKMWEAFFGGEFTGGSTTLGPGSTAEDYRTQTQKFYEELIGPAFLGEEHAEKFGASSLEGWYASFDPLKLQQAEETFRSAIGDPYIPGQDPFAWEKVSRYDTTGGDESRIQQLLESELYGQGKFLGGETGAEYGLETSRTLEDYTTGMRGEREELTYGALTSGVGLASGTSGATLRSGEATGAAEDVLIEAYKKAKTLGSDYRAGKGDVETALEEDLNDALTTYLDIIDSEKGRWFSDVMRNVQTFDKLETGVEGAVLNEDQMAAKLTHLQDYEYGDGLTSQEWGCGYGQTWDPAITDGEGNAVGGCTDTAAYTEERYGIEGDESATGYTFRDDGACGIGYIFKNGKCELMEDLELEETSYGFLCKQEDIDDCGVCGGDNSSCTDDCGVLNGDNSSCAGCDGVPNSGLVYDECNVCGGDGSSCATGGLGCYSDSDCGVCERCDAGGCLPYPAGYESEECLATRDETIIPKDQLPQEEGPGGAF